MTMPDDEWWKPFYDELLADVLLEQTNEAEIDETADFLVNVLGLTPGQRALDQCCGSGRITIALAKRGLIMTGVDLVPNYISRAQARAQGEGLNVDLRVGDAFEFKAEALCDGAFNWWTSFGYSGDDRRNLAMLQRAWDSLRPGGRFALDFMNVPGLYRHFQPHMVTHCRNAQGAVTLVRESALDVACGVIRKHWTYILQDGRRVEHDTSVRLYDPPALRRLFAEAGFRNTSIFGDRDGSSLTLDSARCIVVGQKPEAH
jgi:SAM-dependent methyltransferase